MGLETQILTFIFDLALTAFGYLFVPLILVICKKEYTEKKLKKICLFNCAIVWIIFTLVKIELSGEASVGAAVFLWGVVGYIILKKYCLKEEEIKSPEQAKPINEQKTQPQKQHSLSATEEIPERRIPGGIYGSDIAFVPAKKTEITSDISRVMSDDEMSKVRRAIYHEPSAPIPTKKDSIPSPPTSDKLGNYGVISNVLAQGFTENARKRIKEQITTFTAQYEFVRKTDLMKAVFGYIAHEYENAKGTKTDLVVSAYYQIAFDEIVTQTGDMNDLLYCYSVSKMSGAVSEDIHKYLQMLVRIQFIIDEAIAANKKCDAFRNYTKQLRIRIFEELNSYIDDKTDWNKL